jgi:hypothetical protein
LRYRLRFLLQEFDLPHGATVIGRSLDCNLTIEDPLVSREHARIIIDDDGAHLEDMKSRNGVRVNGLAVHGSTPLRDGDRVRIGTQDLVFCSVGQAGNKTWRRTTGVLRLCTKCRLPYASEMLSCPHCDGAEQTDERTLTTNSEDYRTMWNVELMVEALDRALALGRPVDADRIARRATARLDELILSGGAIEGDALGTVAAKVAAMTLATDDPTWALWVINLYRRTRSIPSLDVANRLAEAAAKHAARLRGPLAELLDSLEPSSGSSWIDESEALARLDQARRLLEGHSQESLVASPSEWPGAP